ncbi:MAG: hypothetical protein MK137_06365 [Rickettsiales bacterium]|nr:hypothetical protein [Rickettsiales bacterium]
MNQHHPHVKEKNRIIEASKLFDGNTEFATLLGKVMPDVAGPVATIPVLTVVSPIVILGIVGLTHEYHEARKEFHSITSQQTSSRDRLVALAQCSSKYRDIINHKLGLNIEFNPDMTFKPSSKTSIDRLATEIVAYEQLQNDKLIAGLGKKYGWTGAVGLSGMFAGVTATTGYSIAKLFSTSAASTASSVISTIASGFFIAGQAVMSVYAGNRMNQGIKELKHLHHHRNDIHQSVLLKQPTKKHVDSVLNKESSFIKKTKVSYGVSTIAGQVLMFAGVILGLTGFGLAATVPLFTAGTLLSVIPGVRRVLNERRETQFKGSDVKSHPYVVNIQEKFKPLNVLGQFKVDDKARFIKASEIIEDKLSDVKNRLTASKALNILYYTVNGRNFRHKNTDEKLEALENRLTRSVNRATKDDAELENTSELITLFQASKNDVKQFLSLPPKEANARLQKASTALLKGKTPKPEEIRKQLLQPSTEQDQGQNAPNSHSQIKQQTHHKLKQNRWVLNAARFELTQQLISLLGVKKMSESIGQELHDYKMLEERTKSASSKDPNIWKQRAKESVTQKNTERLHQ